MSEPPSEASRRDTVPPGVVDPESMPTLRSSGAGERVFGRFRLERELGVGGMAVVWLAHDERLGLPVALKFLSGPVARDPEALDDLRREITQGLRLTHPGIVRIYDLHEDAAAGRAAIAMEYIDGPSVAEEKTRRPGRCFDVAEPLLGWTRTLCEVLQYVHERAKVVHRDLKPRNLMLTAQGELKVADFGIAATLGETYTRLTQPQGSSSGTPAYMSPQQVMGRHPTAADDIYSLGATLYELLTSKPPFFRGTAAVIMNQVSTEAPPSMAARRAELGVTGHAAIPAAWEETIAACLTKEPADRPASVSAVAQRLLLSSAEPDAPTVVTPLGATGNTKPSAPRRRRGVGFWLLPVLAGAAVAAVPHLRSHLSRLTAAVGIAATPTPAPVWKEIFTPAPTPLRTPKPLIADRAVPTPAPRRPATPVSTPVPFATPSPLAVASLAKPFVNSLGMRFVPVPIHGGPTNGRRILFSMWDTRVQDFDAFIRETGHAHEKPLFAQGPTHPVVNVNWREAHLFCEWLSRKEGHLCRLPSDHEWSCAVGLGTIEKADKSPMEKDGVSKQYPWGMKFPPVANIGNYAASLKVDDFEFTSPVASFPPNQFGLYDMGGNVWQWCEEAYNPPSQSGHVSRGGAWYIGMETYMRSSSRGFHQNTSRSDTHGFRCVIEAD